MKQLSVGVVGTGRIGRMHAAHLAFRVRWARLAAVTDLNRSAAEACAEACGGCIVVDSYHEMLQRSDVNAIAICTSSSTHTQIIIDAAAAGKHIFCEKPIDLSLCSIDRALQAVEDSGVCFQVGFNRRFDASFRRVREAIDRGEIGEPHTAHIISRDPEPASLGYIRSSGGLFMDLTIHDFDMANFLLGPDVQTVYAVGAVRISEDYGTVGDVDTATVVLQYGDGTIATIENSRKTSYGYDQRLEVFGSLGAVRAGNARPHTAVLTRREGICRGVPYHFFIERYREAYVEELRQFVQVVLEGRASPATGTDARLAALWGLTAQRSLETGQPVRPSAIDTG